MRDLKTIGWREWCTLPDLEIGKIKAKVDTGARTSSLHADDLKIYSRRDKKFVKFTVHPIQRNSKKTISCHAPVLEFRKIKSSNGISELRPVIQTNVTLFGMTWPIEVTLTNRDVMGFRMLLGRESLKRRFLVDVSSSFFGTKDLKKKAKKKKKKIASKQQKSKKSTKR